MAHPTNRFFVTFDACDSLENCTTFSKLTRNVDRRKHILSSGQPVEHGLSDQKLPALSVLHVFMTADNARRLIAKANTEADFETLSIDIDFNGNWVWKAVVDDRLAWSLGQHAFQLSVACIIPYTLQLRPNRVLP
jgi:hypothetical protein